MEHEFTPEQISQTVRAARVLDPGFTEERLKWLIDGQKRLSDSGFCEACWAVARFERERGVNCADVLDACEKLLQEVARLEGEVANLKELQQTQQNVIRETEQRHRQLIEASGQARKDLAEVKAEREEEERKLATSQKKAEKGKRRIDQELGEYRQRAEAEKKGIDQEVEDYRQRANVVKQEIDAAAELKSQVGKYGFSLEEMLELSQEFAGHQDARAKLAAALKKYTSLTAYVTALKEWAQNRKRALEAEISGLESRRTQEEIQVASLEEIHRHLEGVIVQLQSDVAAEEELRRFYRRYQPVSGLVEYLASWKQVIFYRCNNAISAMTGLFDQSLVAHFWSDKEAVKCPHCGLSALSLDETPYHALNWQVGALNNLQLGE